MGKSHNKGPIGVPGGGLTRDRKSMLSRWNISVGALWGELGGRAPLLGTLKARSYQYPETGSETDIGTSSNWKNQTAVL